MSEPKANIMIIEDEAIIAKDIENILNNYGYSISGIFSKAEEALSSLKTKKPDLILMDVVLKGDLDGIEAAKIIKRDFNIPVIFITAYADDITISRIKKLNAYGYFLKPFEEKEIQAWIETTLEKFTIEQELKRNERIAVSIINNLEEAFITIDETGCIRLMNESAEKLSGINLIEAKGKKLSVIVKSSELENEIKTFHNLSPASEISFKKISAVNYINKPLIILYKIIPFSENNSHEGFTILFKNEDSGLHNELERLTVKLNESNRELEKFAYIASHDLQEPLRMVASYVQLLEKRYKGKLDKQAGEFIDYAVEGVNRMRKLIDDLLLYSRISSKKLKSEKIDCNEIISGILPEIKRVYSISNHSVKFSNLPAIKADRIQMEQLFYHLIENSVKFNEQKEPVVEITSQIQNNKVVFSVCDNGIGIEKQYIERIFEPFQKLHHHKEYTGSGIGLTICKKITELHGGRISVESEPGNGTVFRIELPLN
jgi:signal transduction histidine kinase